MKNEIIKLRAWEGEIRLYRTGCEKNRYTKDEELVRSAMIDDEYKLIIMQYIGLKDNNDVEIYEGDIFELFSIIEVVTIDYHHGIRSKYGRDDFCKSYCEGKVIGNIYENPDLVIAINDDK